MGRRLVDRLLALDYRLYRFFAYWGEVIVSRRSRFFYAVLLIAAVFHPLFAGFLA